LNYTSHDTAFRIGAKLDLLPVKAYLHAGARVGARALGYDRRLPWIEVSDLPRQLRRLKPYEIEDLLCIYKDVLGSARKSTQKPKRQNDEFCLIVNWNPDGTHDIGGFKSHRPHHIMGLTAHFRPHSRHFDPLFSRAEFAICSISSASS
jgi:hypothetical protein